MKSNFLCLLMLALLVGCIYLPESADEHDQSIEFWRALNNNSRILAIFDYKPNKRFAVLGNSQEIIIIINSPQITEFSFVLGIPDKSVPGNQYTPEEVAVIEDVALSIKDKLGIKRKIWIYDESLEKGHYAKKLEAVTKP